MPSRIVQAAAVNPVETKSGALPCAIDKLSIVIPLYNEREGMNSLLERLFDFEKCNDLSAEMEFLFIDDGSCDGTAEELRRLLVDRQNCKIISHQNNQGIASAIRTGMLHSTGDCVVSIDSDGSYEIDLLLQMLQQFTANVDIIVASPYHPHGRVENVSAWRIALSKCASRMYRTVMKQKLCCYTSCFRVYRRDRCKNITTQDTRFVGVAEFLWRAENAGLNIVEYPATLRPRLIGRSKMKLARAMMGHMRLLAKIGMSRTLPFASSPRAMSRTQSEVI
jgi:dolichol-phosphate mannosyltransferase